MDLFTYLLGKKGQNTQRDLFSYLLGKGAGGSGTYVNFSGTSLNISNTLRARIKNIELKGATRQYTTTGKNLFNDYRIVSTTTQGLSIEGDGNSVIINGTYTKQNPLDLWLTQSNNSTYTENMTLLEANKTYTISVKIASGTISDTSVVLRVSSRTENDKTFSWNYRNLEYSNGEYKVTFTPTEKIYIGAIRIPIGTNNNIIFTNAKLYIQIEEGNTATDYEEYTGGNPSPSPDYPQKVKVVTGEQNVNVSSKNLFNKENYIDNYYIGANGSHVYQSGNFIGDYINVNTGNYIASGSPNIIRCATYDKDKNFIRRELATNGASLSITITSEEKFVRLSGYKSFLDTLQFEPGSTATSYTPYYSKDYPLSFGSWNLLNYDLETESYYYDSSGNKTYDNTFKYINQRIEVGLGSSITCTAESMTSNALMRICEFSSNDLFLKRSLVSTTERTITLNNNTSYVIVSIDKSNDRYFLKPQITKGTDIKPYCPYGEHYNENPLELAKIGDYQDYIYGTPNNWYKYEKIKKIVLPLLSLVNAVNDNISSPQSTSKNGTFSIFKNDIAIDIDNNTILSTIAKYNYNSSIIDNVSAQNNLPDNSFCMRQGINDRIYFKCSSFTGLTGYEIEQKIIGTIIYYSTTNPHEILLTDTTLIEQLNNLYNATSQDGTTIITCTSGSSDNETIVFSGDIKVASLGNPLNTSLLSSNIQEETNIDDIQEEPNVDEVNKIEDIEQNEEPIEEEVS